MRINLASSGLTKIITFTPYYMLINQAKVSLGGVVYYVCMVPSVLVLYSFHIPTSIKRFS